MLITLLAILGVAFLLGFSILVHEFGHFVAAKLSGVGVEVFAIGFGPRIWSKKWRGTEYAFNWVPFGGYVKMTGMLLDELEEKQQHKEQQDEEQPAEESQEEQQVVEEKKDSGMISEKAMGDDPLADMAALRNKPLPLKIMIFSAGCFFNYLTAIVIFSLLFLAGFTRPKPMESFIGPVPENSTLAMLGIRQGDRVTMVGHEEVKTWGELSDQVEQWTDRNPGTSVSLTLERSSGDSYRVTVPPPEEWKEDKSFSRYFYPPYPTYISSIWPHQAAYRAGLKEGDYITAINGQPIEYDVEARAAIEKFGDEPLTITYQRDGEEFQCEVKPKPSTEPTDNNRNIIGIFFGNDQKIVTKHGPVKAIAAGFAYTNRWVVTIPVETVKVFGSGFRNIRANVGGPLLIMNITYIQAKKGVQDYLHFFAIINLILMIMNLLPIPVLDGGHIVLSVIESIIRRPVPEKILIPVFNVVFLLLMTLIVLITFNDVITIFF